VRQAGCFRAASRTTPAAASAPVQWHSSSTQQPARSPVHCARVPVKNMGLITPQAARSGSSAPRANAPAPQRSRTRCALAGEPEAKEKNTAPA